MATFAEIQFGPGRLIAWLIAGFLAGRVMKGSGYGLIGDIVVGLVGALVGGFVFGLVVTGTPRPHWQHRGRVPRGLPVDLDPPGGDTRPG